MGFNFFTRGRPDFTRFRRVLTQPVIRRPEPEPIPTPPQPTATPGFRSALIRALDADEAARPFEDVAARAGQESQLSTLQYGFAQQEARRMEEEAQQAKLQTQQLQMDAIRRGFAPRIDDLDTHVKQAAAFRSGTGGRPYNEVLEEERLNEGSRRASEFSRIMQDFSPQERATLAPLSAGLLKEGLTGETFEDIVEAAKQDDGTVYQFTRQDRKKANRVLTSILEMQAGEGPAPRAPETLIPEDYKSPDTILREQQEKAGTPFRKQLLFEAGGEEEPDRGRVGVGDIFGGIKEAVTEGIPFAARTAVDVAEQVAKMPLPIEVGEGLVEITREVVQLDASGAFDELKEAGGEIGREATEAGGRVLDIFEAEQRLIAPWSRQILGATLQGAGLPLGPSRSIAKYLAEFAVPSSIIPAAKLKGGVDVTRQITRLLPTMLAEGSVNLLQNRAGRKSRGEEEPPLWEDFTAFFAGAGFRGIVDGGLFKLRARGVDASLPAHQAAAKEVPSELAQGAPLETGVRQAPDIDQPSFVTRAEQLEVVTPRPPATSGYSVALKDDPTRIIGTAVSHSRQGVVIRTPAGETIRRSFGETVAVREVDKGIAAAGRGDFPEEVPTTRTEAPEEAVSVGEEAAEVAKRGVPTEASVPRAPEPTVKASEAEATKARTKAKRAETTAKKKKTKETKTKLQEAQAEKQSAESKAEGAKRRASPKKTAKEKAARAEELRTETPEARDFPEKGTDEYNALVAQSRSRLDAILDDPTIPKADKKRAEALFAKVCA